MGIKGIYGEIGPGERVSLSKLAIDQLEKTGQPLRIAIDISIWQFQIQAGQGGSNPAIRTFYYRLLRLMSVSVRPLFVFDGPHKPTFKRNKRSGHHGASLSNMLCKRLLRLFGYPFHMAPGEAEAECALLQREGIVDAVLSEDVDTLMFGSGLTLRNWSSEGRGNKSPTHVSAYYAKATKDGKSGLDREGMILVALMSGGDYNTEGIPGCGVKAACEAARAGFGKSLCQLPRADKAGLDAWRENLTHEIRTNESKFFRIKHKSLKIPEDFPNKEVLGYYTHPIVSSATKVQKLKDEILWDGEIDIQGLRNFVAEAFEWTNKMGAKKFIRGLAPVLLVYKLRLRGDRRSSGYGDVILTAMNEMELVRSICGKRSHFSTDGLPELRVLYHPAEIVGLDLDAEEDDSEEYGRDGLAPLNEDDEIEAYASDPDSRLGPASPSKRAPSLYDPTQPDRLWIPEAIAKVGIPLKVEDYAESLRDPKKFLRAKAAAKRAATKKGMPKGAMDAFVRTSKPGVESNIDSATKASSKTRSDSSQSALPPVYLAPSLEKPLHSSSRTTIATSTRATRQSNPTSLAVTVQKTSRSRAPRTALKPKVGVKVTAEKASANTNPWTIASSSSPRQAPPTIKNNDLPEPQKQTPRRILSPRITNVEINLTSSPPTPLSRKHNHSPHLESDPEDEIAADSSMSLGDLAALQIRTPGSEERCRDRPSPRKKRSPLESSETSPRVLPRHAIKDLTPEPVNRRIDFSSASRAHSSSPELPTYRALVQGSASKSQRAKANFITLSSSPESSSPQITQEVSKLDAASKSSSKNKYIMLRESLPGSWKLADASELVRGKSRAWRYSEVECLDLTEE